MKKILILLIILCVLFGLVACGKPTEEKIAEGIAEGIVEEIGDEILDLTDVSVDSSEGKITINDGDNQLVFEGSEDGMPWPFDKLTESVPELKGIKVVSVTSTGGGILIGFEECDKDEALVYIEEIKNAGWNVLMEMSEDDGGMLTTNNDAGESLMFVWNTEDQGGAITYGSAQ